ncbi:MAG: HPr family phosphocarrier protein [Planctomycetota bacterium]|nr:HPr family phosphocarrier protein [Planctomycetota bacterium]
MTTATTTVTVSNKLGMHARPAMLLAEVAGRFSSSITVSHDTHDPVDAKSIMQLMLLAATKGTNLHITADGDDANEAVQELESLINAGFNE